MEPKLIIAGYGQEANLLDGNGEMVAYIRVVHVDTMQDVTLTVSPGEFKELLALIHTGAPLSAEGGDDEAPPAVPLAAADEEDGRVDEF